MLSTDWWFLFFFFQAEDGIRYLTVTGVQTCALPISVPPFHPPARPHAPGAPVRARRPRLRSRVDGGRARGSGRAPARGPRRRPEARRRRAPQHQREGGHRSPAPQRPPREIGKASGRGREEISVGGGSLKKKKK